MFCMKKRYTPCTKTQKGISSNHTSLFSCSFVGQRTAKPYSSWTTQGTPPIRMTDRENTGSMGNPFNLSSNRNAQPKLKLNLVLIQP